MQNKNMKLNMQ